MHSLVREMAVARVRSLEDRVVSLALLHAALVIDVAAAVVRAEMPGALFLVRSQLDRDEIADWISISTESGYSEWDDSHPNYHNDDAPPEFTGVRRSDTYERALFGNGILRPLNKGLESLVEQVSGSNFHGLIELAHENQLGAYLWDVSSSTEVALGMVGWDSLVRSHQVAEIDAVEGRESSVYTHLHWSRVVLHDWGPHLLNVGEELRDTDVRVKDALAAEGTGLSWDVDGLRMIPSLALGTQSDLHAARVDLLEIDVRIILDLTRTVGEPTAVIAAVVDADYAGNEAVELDTLEGFLVPVQVLSGSLPIFDFFDFWTTRRL